MSRESLSHRAEFALFRCARRVLLALPEPVSVLLGSGLGTVAGSVLRIRRRDVDRHLAWAFPEMAPRARARLARASYRHLGREAVTFFRLPAWSRERVVERTQVEGLDALREALDRAGGAILLTGHLGSWEVGGAALAARGLPVDAVAKGMANRRFQAELFQARERLGLRLVEPADAARRLPRALRSGRVAAFVADQNAHRGGVFVPFFGRLASTARGAALFAIRTGVPAFVGFALREPGLRPRYRVVLEPLPFAPSGDAEEDVRTFAAAYNAAVELAVRARPEQYFWPHKRWKTRPPAGTEHAADAGGAANELPEPRNRSPGPRL